MLLCCAPARPLFAGSAGRADARGTRILDAAGTVGHGHTLQSGRAGGYDIAWSGASGLAAGADRRTEPGVTPWCRLNARLNAASEV